MNMKHIIHLLILMVILSSTKGLMAEDIYILTSETSNLPKLEVFQLKNLYLGRTALLNGKRVNLLDQKEDQSLFLQRVLKKNKNQYKSLWKMKTFTGKGKAPKIVNKHQLQHILSQQENAISYSTDKASTENLKVLLTVSSP